MRHRLPSTPENTLVSETALVQMPSTLLFIAKCYSRHFSHSDVSTSGIIHLTTSRQRASDQVGQKLILTN